MVNKRYTKLLGERYSFKSIKSDRAIIILHDTRQRHFLFPNKIKNNVHFIQTSENKHYSDSLWAFSRTILHLCFTPFVENAVHKTLLCKQTTPYPSENCIPGTMALMWSDRAPGKTATSSNNKWKHPWNGRKLNKFSESTSSIKNWSTLLAVSITRWSLQSKSEV